MFDTDIEYLFLAYCYATLIDQEYTPQLIVDMTINPSELLVPEHLKSSSVMTFNIGLNAVKDLCIDKELKDISFSATFNGIDQTVVIPFNNVVGYNIKENPQMVIHKQPQNHKTTKKEKPKLAFFNKKIIPTKSKADLHPVK
jgi:stringent starvation protein B